MLPVSVRKIFSRSTFDAAHRAACSTLPFGRAIPNSKATSEMQEFLEQRSLEQVLADLRASYQRRPGPVLAEMLRNVEAEIALRDAGHQGQEAGKRPSMRRCPHSLTA